MDNSLKNRKSSIEILRIVAMFFIVLSHLFLHTNFSFAILPNNIPFNYFVTLIRFGNISVDIFFIIFGYFTICKTFDIKHIAKIEFESIFYASLIYCFCSILGITNFSIKSLLFCFVPTLTGQWWFLSAYILVYTMSPIINKIINNMNIKIVLILDILAILTCFILFCLNIDSTLITIADCFEMYILGAVLRKTNYEVGIYKCTSMVLAAMIFVFFIITINNVKNVDSICTLENLFNKLLYRTSPVSVLIATYTFLLFLNFTFYNKQINAVASNIFAVYLIQSNRYLSNIIWNGIIQINKFENSSFFIFYSIFTCLILMIICIFVEEIRKLLFKKLHLPY